MVRWGGGGDRGFGNGNMGVGVVVGGNMGVVLRWCRSSSVISVFITD